MYILQYFWHNLVYRICYALRGIIPFHTHPARPNAVFGWHLPRMHTTSHLDTQAFGAFQDILGLHTRWRKIRLSLYKWSGIKKCPILIGHQQWMERCFCKFRIIYYLVHNKRCILKCLEEKPWKSKLMSADNQQLTEGLPCHPIQAAWQWQTPRHVLHGRRLHWEHWKQPRPVVGFSAACDWTTHGKEYAVRGQNGRILPC